MGKGNKKARKDDKSKVKKPTKEQLADDAENLMILSRRHAYYLRFTEAQWRADVAEHQKEVDKHQKIIDDLNEKWKNRDAILAEIERKLKQGKAAFVKKKNAKKIESLEKLVAQSLELAQQLKDQGVDIGELTKAVKLP